VFRIAYHSRTRFATRRRGVEALAPFAVAESSNINRSSSGGKRGSREFVPNIECLCHGCREWQVEVECQHKGETQCESESVFT
jgi:hypothetical protein